MNCRDWKNGVEYDSTDRDPSWCDGAGFLGRRIDRGGECCRGVEVTDGESEVQGNEDGWLRGGAFAAAESVQVAGAAGGSVGGVSGIHGGGGGGGVRCRREGGEGEGEGGSAGVCDDAFGQRDGGERGEPEKGDDRGDGCAEERGGGGGDDGRVVGFGGEREAWGV